MTLPYIVNVALVLAACLVFYKLLLRKETFYRLNRYLLIVCLGVSFALPLLSVPEKFSFRKSAEPSVMVTEPVRTGDKTTIANGEQPATSVQQPISSNDQSATVNKGPVTGTLEQSKSNIQPTSKFSFAKLLTWAITIYWFGVIVFAASFLFQCAMLAWKAFRYPVIKDGKFRIVEMTGDKAPCSFGNIIFINPEKYEWDTYNQILLHEKIHISQKHTIDIIIAELVLVFQWFNPFAWIYRREIESNLEFLTDDQLVKHAEVDKRSYQLSLVKVSAPHMPLSLTTNYNQSILKTRIAMMNRKRSNLHTAWKYFFLMPVLAFLACLLNEPVSHSQGIPNNNKNGENAKNEMENEKNAEKNKERDIKTEGSWFATIKGEKISIQFRNDDEEKDGNHVSGNTYKLTDFTPVPKEGVTFFKMTRDAGTMELTGRIEGAGGMGKYKFIADKAFAATLSNDLKEKMSDEDMMVFFFVNLTKGYVPDLKSEGYSNLTKEELIPLAALEVDKTYIRSIKNSGFKDVSLENLVPLKALGVDEKYITEIRSAGFKNITTEQLVSFKAQGIDKEYIGKVKTLRNKDNNSNKNNEDEDDDAGDLISFKAMGIDDDFVNSFRSAGLNNIPNEQLVSFKALGVTPEYIKSWHNAGFKDIKPDEFVGMKSQNITPEYMKQFTDMGYKNIKPENLVAFSALGVTPEFIKSFEAIGYKDIDFDELPGLKSQNVTPELVKTYEALGFKNIKLEDLIAVKATGVTPEYIKDMRAKGFNYDKLHKYVTLKSID